MDCNRLEEYLNLYLDDALSEEQRTALEAHAAECEACGREYAAARQMKALLAELPDEMDVPLPAQAQWRTAVKAEAGKARIRKLYRYVGGIAAALLVLFGAGLLLRPGTPNAADSVIANSMDAAGYESAWEGEPELKSLMMVEADGQSVEKATEAPESAAIADAVPMREISLKVADLEEACEYFHDLIEEYEGTLDEQRFDSNGQPCANLFVKLPGENSAEFIQAAARYAHSPAEEPDIAESMEEGDLVSMLLVLRSE